MTEARLYNVYCDESCHPEHDGVPVMAWGAVTCPEGEVRSIAEAIRALKIGGDFFDKMAGQWREEQRRLQRDIDRHEEAEQSYMDEGVRILELARNAQALFERQPAREKRRLLNFVLSNCSWEDGEVVATFRQPFDLLAETTAIAARSSAGSGGISSKTEIWLGW